MLIILALIIIIIIIIIILSNTEYLHRHNLSAKIVHQFLAQRHKLITTDDPYYKYEPQPVLENESTKIYWD
jgi:hypothetical protein